MVADPAVAADARRALLAAPHMRTLADYAASLREQGLGAIPDMDPLDGGTAARALFLLEKPGPGAVASGFVSRDNADPTAVAIRRFMDAAGLDRGETVIWNAVPGWNGTIAVRGDELRRGLACLPGLLALLPVLRVAVLVGRRAEQARDTLAGSGLTLLASAHPSPQVRAAFPARWQAVPAVWAGVRCVLED